MDDVLRRAIEGAAEGDEIEILLAEGGIVYCSLGDLKDLLNERDALLKAAKRANIHTVSKSYDGDTAKEALSTAISLCENGGGPNKAKEDQ